MQGFIRGAHGPQHMVLTAKIRHHNTAGVHSQASEGKVPVEQCGGIRAQAPYTPHRRQAEHALPPAVDVTPRFCPGSLVDTWSPRFLLRKGHGDTLCPSEFQIPEGKQVFTVSHESEQAGVEAQCYHLGDTSRARFQMPARVSPAVRPLESHVCCVNSSLLTVAVTALQ